MDISKIKTLRELTGLGMLEVKNALIEAKDDLEEAKRILMQQTVKKSESTRVASKGLTRVETHHHEAILFEINAETDFIAKHPDFIKLMTELGHLFVHSKAITVKQALNLSFKGATVLDEMKRVENLVKEHLHLRRFHRIKKQEEQSFSTYMHAGGKVSVLVIYQGDETLGKDLALHITSHAPKYLSVDTLDQETYHVEEMMMLKENHDLTQEDIKRNIIQLCLYEQPYIKQPDRLVKDVLKDTKVIDFYRFELGQGIENKLNCRLDIPCDGSKITVTPHL